MTILSKEEITRITNEACSLLQAADPDEKNVLAFEESGDTVQPVLLTGSQINGKSDLFPRGTDPSLEIFMHLASLYGDANVYS